MGSVVEVYDVNLLQTDPDFASNFTEDTWSMDCCSSIRRRVLCLEDACTFEPTVHGNIHKLDIVSFFLRKDLIRWTFLAFYLFLNVVVLGSNSHFLKMVHLVGVA